MRVLIYATKFYPFKGGLEKFVLELSKKLVDNNIQVDVATFNLEKWKVIDSVGRINILRYDCFKVLPDVYSLPKLNKTNKQINKILKGNNYDFVITNTRFFFSSYMGKRFAKKNKIKHIHIEHGNVLPKIANPLVWFVNRIYEYTLGKSVFKNSNWTVGVSKRCSLFAKKMGAKNVSTIHNSINIKEFSGALSQLKEDKFTITFVGRLIEGKGVQDLIKAVSGIDIRLSIVGDGPYRNKLISLIKQANIDCVFHGTQPSSSVKIILKGSDLFVNPSYSEGLPTSVLEAGAMKLPVIATDVGGTSEIIKHGENGVLYKPKDIVSLRTSIMHLMKNKELRKSMGEKLRSHIEKNFDWNVTGQKFIILMGLLNDELYG